MPISPQDGYVHLESLESSLGSFSQRSLAKFHDLCSKDLDFPCLNSASTLEDLERFYFNIPPTTIGAIIAREFERQVHLPGALIVDKTQLIALISRRTFLERLSQPYGIELFLKRPIQVFLSIAALDPPLVLAETERIDRASQLALQRLPSQIYEPIVVQGTQDNLSILSFQTLLLAQSHILSLQKEELVQQSAQIEILNNQLSWQASHDPLTHLVNRRAFEQRLDSSLSILKERETTHILCYLDLDRFKIINDTCGHLAGDELLKQVAALMRNSVRQTDVIGRLGGDEFALLLHCCNLDRGIQVANSLRQSLEDLRFVWENQVFRIGASIGIVVMNNANVRLQDILRAADNACYAAKNKGRNRVYVYQDDDKELLKERTTVNSFGKLQKAIDDNRLCLYSQPLTSLKIDDRCQGVDKDSGKNLDCDVANLPIAACEILLRVKDEDGNILPPGPFIVAAERYKLMHQIDRWVLTRLCAYLKRNLDSAHPLYMVNLSGETLRDEEFPFFVESQIKQNQIPPSLLCFEITETAAITNFNQASTFIRHLRELGCHFALDDFGSGMSSFTYLKHFAVDFLKIDGLFTRDIATDPLNFSIIKAMHEVGHAVGLQTIVEGVEDITILPILQSLGIEYAQGYGIQYPQPLEPL